MVEMENVLAFLATHGVHYVLHEHPAVYTCEEAEIHCGHIDGIPSKNLFLRNDKGTRHFLVVLPAAKRADLKGLAMAVGERRISFASSARLQQKLGLQPGAVSPFGLINDRAKAVEVYIDRQVYEADPVTFHPNVNTATLELSREMFRRFLQVVGHRVEVVDL